MILTVEDGKFVVVLFGGEYSLLLHDLERLSRLEVEVVPAANWLALEAAAAAAAAAAEVEVISEAAASEQVWSQTHSYSVSFLQSAIIETKCVFHKHSIKFEEVLWPPQLALYT